MTHKPAARLTPASADQRNVLTVAPSMDDDTLRKALKSGWKDVIFDAEYFQQVGEWASDPDSQSYWVSTPFLKRVALLDPEGKHGDRALRSLGQAATIPNKRSTSKESGAQKPTPAMQAMIDLAIGGEIRAVDFLKSIACHPETKDPVARHAIRGLAKACLKSPDDVQPIAELALRNVCAGLSGDLRDFAKTALNNVLAQSHTVASPAGAGL